MTDLRVYDRLNMAKYMYKEDLFDLIAQRTGLPLSSVRRNARSSFGSNADQLSRYASGVLKKHVRYEGEGRYKVSKHADLRRSSRKSRGPSKSRGSRKSR